jgi:hypothetical protein
MNINAISATPSEANNNPTSATAKGIARIIGTDPMQALQAISNQHNLKLIFDTPSVINDSTAATSLQEIATTMNLEVVTAPATIKDDA